MNAVSSSITHWQAYLSLKLSATEDKTRLQPIRRYGPLSVQRPFYPEGDCCHVYLLHPPGGVVGGDSLQLDVDMGPQSSALFTTPGATKFYLSAGEQAQVDQSFRLSDQAALEYLPQENIYFPGALVHATTRIDVRRSSHLLLWEKHCFGRPANNEFFEQGQLISEIRLTVDGKLTLLEKQRIDANEIRRACGLRGHPVMATFVVYSECLDTSLLQPLRDIDPGEGISGITRPVPQVLVARYIGNSTAEVNQYFIRLLALLRPQLLQRALCQPRIWNT